MITDRKLQVQLPDSEPGDEPLDGGIVDYYIADVVSQSDYFPFGMLLPNTNFSVDPVTGLDVAIISDNDYRYAFNGMEDDEEMTNQNGTSYDFGARLYNPRVGRWFSTDALESKYTDLSPYIFTANNPMLFVDYDGQDFGLKIDHDKKTVTIVSNIYVMDEYTKKQALAGAKQWNDKITTVDGYSIIFEVNVLQPDIKVSDEDVMYAYSTVNFYKKNGKINKKLMEKYRIHYKEDELGGMAQKDPIGNVYTDGYGNLSDKVSGQNFVGGTTYSGYYIAMNTHDVLMDLGKYSDLVAHEMGHTFGLDDEGKPYFPGHHGVMKYLGTDLYPIHDEDVKTIIRYINDVLNNRQIEEESATIILLETKGEDPGNGPIQVDDANDNDNIDLETDETDD